MTDNLQNSPRKGYILVAEDNKFYLQLLESELSENGYEVKTVGDGQQAIDAVKARMPDLLLLDLILPVKDGFDVIKELKSDESTEKVKIVVFSTLGQEEDVKKITDMGAAGYIAKSNFSLKDLVDEISSFME